MKNKGYTLLELLGVIILLALLTILVFPSVINTIKRTNDKTDELSMKLISNAVDLYIKNNPDHFMKYNGNKYEIEIEDLLDNGNLPESIKLSNNKDINDKCLEVSYKNDKFTYTLKDKGTCEQITLLESICTPVTETDVGNVPEGNYQAGDKYRCKVDPDKQPYTFYVLTSSGERDTSIDLIMDRNICQDGTLTNSNKSDKCLVAYNSSGDAAGAGPVTAMNYLNNATNTWSNVESLNMTYDDEGNHFINFPITGKARLPRYDEVHGDGKCLDDGYGSCPLWLVNYLNSNSDVTGEGLENISGIYGYWTISANSASSSSAWIVYYYGLVNGGSVDSDAVIGVRPVITLNIEREELPKDYQEVEYIESTGTQYLIIDYIASGITSSKGKFQITDTTKAAFLFGSRAYSGSIDTYCLNWGGGTPYYFWKSYSTPILLSDSPIDDKVHMFYMDKGNFYLDNKLVHGGSPATFTTPTKMNIFGSYSDGVNGYLSPYARIFNLKFYDNDTLMVNLIPCYRKSDNVIGMYDLVNDKFYTNSGTGTFLKGKDI